MIDINNVYSFVGGLIVAGGAAIGFINNRISPSEAQDIYDHAKAAINEYNKAKVSGTLTDKEKLRIAETVLEVFETIIKDLEK
jgi:hypothetical protein